MKVLIIDDEAPIRQWLEFCINQLEEFTVVGTAEDGYKGLELFKKKQPDIVITDIEMPGMNGLEMMRFMQKIHPAYMIILSSHDDFSYARQALQQGTAEYILKTEITADSINRLLDKALLILKGYSASATAENEHTLQQLLQITRSNSNRAISEQLLKRHGIDLKEDTVLCIDIWSDEGKNFFKAKKFLQKQPELYNCIAAQIGYDHMLILANITDRNQRNSLIERCQKQILYLDCIIGVSDIASSFLELPKAIKLARARCQSYFYCDKKRLICEGPVTTWKLEHIETRKSAYSKALFKQNYQEAVAIKDWILKDIIEKQPADLNSVKDLCTFLVTTLLYFFEDNTERAEAEVERISRCIQKAEKLEDMLIEMENIFKPIEKKLISTRCYSEPIQKTVDYIEIHYNQKLTLKAIAGMANFTPEYFSKIFTQETGKNFVTYVNEVRMKHAAQLLEDTEKKIYEIAEETGFSSVSYFLTSFKKFFGKTPNEYRSE